ENILALTSLQEGMLFHYLQAPQSRLYFEQLSLQISGIIDGQCFKNAWNVVVQGNEMLRTVFRWEKLEKPSQIILKEYPCRIIFHDLSIKDGSRKKNLEEIKTEDRNDGFDLTHVPFRVILCKLDKTKYEIILSNHHILYDGWSNGIILKEFFNAYYSLHQGERGEQSLKLPAKSSFKEFIRWLQSRDKNKQEQYWRNYLAGFETTTGLPIKKRITETTTVEDYSITLEEDIKSKLDVFIKNNRVTLASVFYTAWGILLQRYCGSEDVIFGTTVSGRSGGIKGIENMVGLFINTIPLRTQTTPNEKIIDVVFEIDHVLREREEFENTPLPDIRDCSYMGRSGSLFDTIVAIENYPLDSRLLPEGNLLAVKSYSIAEMTHYDLTVIIMPFNKIEIKFYFKQELFEKNTFENFARHFKEIIQIIIEKPGIALPKLEILAKEEINQLLYEFNDTKTGYPDDKTLYELFEEQVMKTPGSVAVVFEDQTLSYGGLNEKANQLAGYLNTEINIQPGEPVAVLMDRSINIVTAILGVLEAGGAYVPIDASLPEFRIKHMIDDAGIRVVISGKSQIKILNRLQWECKNFHTFMCMDSASVYEEEEAEKNESMNEGIWKYIGESAADDITVGGWISSYTGEPFSKEEMQEYSDNTFRKLNPLLHKGMRVLEIGCSSGITMFRIAPYAGFYYGTDLSSVIIEKNKNRAKAEGYKNITLDCLPAHDMDTIADENFDLIIINSVVQYFYGHNYLRKVIVKAIAKLALKGYLFLGDIMDQERKKNLIREIGEFKRANNDKNYRTKTDWNAELFVARGFFEDLALQIPGIQNIEFSDKIYTIENELTKFRYDTLITVDKSKYKHNENKAALRQKCQHDLTTLNTFSSQRGIYQKKQAVQPKGTAYVIYTSGTSGLPKGIMIEHRSVINFIKGMTAVIDFRKDDRILSLTTISFDIFGLEVLLPLTRGSEVVIGNREEQSDPGAMSRILVKKTISILQLTPSRLQVLLSGEIHKALFKGLKY
ncbi:MAG TPA: condensation domain-containing protein, partial [Candidatus Kapabacteria bacterium]|nr:condensation domain-containing protein [Candidatus Kapabacteria bacterium]